MGRHQAILWLQLKIHGHSLIYCYQTHWSDSNLELFHCYQWLPASYMELNSGLVIDSSRYSRFGTYDGVCILFLHRCNFTGKRMSSYSHFALRGRSYVFWIILDMEFSKCSDKQGRLKLWTSLLQSHLPSRLYWQLDSYTWLQRVLCDCHLCWHYNHYHTSSKYLYREINYSCRCLSGKCCFLLCYHLSCNHMSIDLYSHALCISNHLCERNLTWNCYSVLQDNPDGWLLSWYKCHHHHYGVFSSVHHDNTSSFNLYCEVNYSSQHFGCECHFIFDFNISC